MEFSKKQRTEDDGNSLSSLLSPSSVVASLTTEDICKILRPFTKDQLLDVLQFAVLAHRDVIDAVCSIANHHANFRRLFVRGLHSETTSTVLHDVFSVFGPIQEAIVILDKVTERSKGYGFVTFERVEGAILALKEPSKRINGRMAVAMLASTGIWPNENDAVGRKIFVWNAPFDVSSERLLSYFETFGEVVEGPLGFEKVKGKRKGYAFFVYKTKEEAEASLVEPIKIIDGYQVNCRMAVDVKKGSPTPPTLSPVPTLMPTPTQANYYGDGTTHYQQYHPQHHHHQQQQQQLSLHAPPAMVPVQHVSSLHAPPAMVPVQQASSLHAPPAMVPTYNHAAALPAIQPLFGDPSFGSFAGVSGYGEMLPPNPVGIFSDGTPFHPAMAIPMIPHGGMFQGMPHPYY